MPSETAKFRKYPRLRAPKGLWVAWKSSAQTTTSRAEVMGMGGLFLQAAQTPSDGSYIELIFDLPTGQVRGRAIVRDSTPGKGMGIQFVQMKPEDRAKLNRFLSALEVSQQAAGAAPAANKAPAGARPATVHAAASRSATTLPASWQLVISRGSQTVSYTHLDVYKRQNI